MKAKNEVISILKSLKSTEWLWLQKFLASPYHNSDQRLIPLGRYYQSIMPAFAVKAEEAYQICFPNQDFDTRKWGDLLRKFLAVLHDFIIQQQLKASSATSSLLAIDGRMQRQLYELIPEKINTYDTAIKEATLLPWEEADAYRQRWQKQYELPGTSPSIEDIGKATTYSRLVYCLLELRYRIEQQIVDTQAYLHDPPQEKAVLALAEKLSTEWPILQLYIHTYLALRKKTPPVDLLQASEQYYYKHYAMLHPKDRAYFFTKLFVLFNRNTAAQRPNAREDFFQLVSFAVEKGIFLYSTKMTKQTFLNICSIGIGAGKLVWVEQFRTTYLPQLDHTINNNAAILSGAFLEFARGNYEKVYIVSSEASRMPIGHRLQLYGVQIKALTERYLLDQINPYPLRDYLRAADRFLRYHAQIRDHFRAEFLALIKILRKLIIMREGRKQASVIKKRLNQMKKEAGRVTASLWLQDKIDQL